ncbi:hypothetical protein FRX31_024842, partial [Thalictrum thalictroides]
ASAISSDIAACFGKSTLMTKKREEKGLHISTWSWLMTKFDAGVTPPLGEPSRFQESIDKDDWKHFRRAFGSLFGACRRL